MMSEVPVRVRELLEERERARATKDFARADALRAEIEAAGFEVRDASGGATLTPKATFEILDPSAIREQLSDPATIEWSVTLLYEGFLDDLERFLRGFEQHNDTSSAEVLVVDNASEDAVRIETLIEPRAWARCLHLSRQVGWATARNLGLRCARGAMLVVADLSIEPSGDILSALAEALADPEVAVAGPYGLVSDDLRSWRETSGPDAAAIEGYMLATTREQLVAAGGFSERFEWYRNADLDLSLALRAAGAKRARVVRVPLRKHEHRGWAALDEPTREQRSRRNYRVFLDRWRDRTDLIV